MMSGEVVIKVQSLKKYFEIRKGFFDMFSEQVHVKAVDDVDFEIREGEILGLVGESGCGKTTCGRLLTRLEDPTGGSVFFMNRDISLLEGEDLKIFRRNIQMVFQDPYESLNPRTTVLQTVMEPLINHGIGDSFEDRVEIVTKALGDSGLTPAKEYLARFPHELSGGQRQRVSIARALVIDPRVIVADEPVSMLDVSIRAGVLNLMLDLRDKYRIPYLFITHDIAVARYISDRLAVMYLGKIVEIGETDSVVFESKHPYTQALISAVPVPDPAQKHGRAKIMGEIPSAINLPLGCRFRPRCPKAFELCGWEARDMIDWLMDEQKISSPDHPLSDQIDRMDPDGFVLRISMKPGGSPKIIKEFMDSKIAELKASRPMFRAVASVDSTLGDREIVISCSPLNVGGDIVARELMELIEEAVDYKSPSHPMYGTIVDTKRDGNRIFVSIGAEDEETKEAIGKSKMESTVGFVKDFVKHRRKSQGYTELSGVKEIKGDDVSKKVVIECGPGKMSVKRVTMEVADMIKHDFMQGPRSSAFEAFLPPKVRAKSISVQIRGSESRWEDLINFLKKYFDEKIKEGMVVPKGVSKVFLKMTKGPKDLVTVRFITSEQPPLVDTGNGHQVACYLFKQKTA